MSKHHGLHPVAGAELLQHLRHVRLHGCLADEEALARQGDRPLLTASDARVFRHGFNDQSTELWSDDGQLLAMSHQVVWFKG